jgi:CRISPR/Cas system-associated exonuclease Cas4 (RecB family)
MQKQKLQCPICKAKHELQLTKQVYACPSCGRKVRAMSPVVAKHDKMLKVKEEELQKKVIEEAAKEIEKALENEPVKKKKTKKKPKKTDS